MVWASAGPHHNPRTDASSQNFFTVILPWFDILARVAILLRQRVKAMMELIEFRAVALT
jgi:hypothetical protein